ncbi:apolipoprotein B receptor [Panthera pardus]|uniref:Apolipoprotein B receptor n=1 Tax=Panthera pardus TaxID=9691 RepID=A0A9W2UVP9_PANPR|nr:apolipoprotein B receptor [Panthera pardus]
MDFLRLHLPGLHQALRGALDSLSTFVSYLMGDEVPTVERREARAAEELGEVAAGRPEETEEKGAQEALEGLGGSQNKEGGGLREPREAGRYQEGGSATKQTWDWEEGSSHGSQANRQLTGAWEAAKAARCQEPSAHLEAKKTSGAGSKAGRDNGSQTQESRGPNEQEVNREETRRTWEQEEEAEEIREGKPGVAGKAESEWTWQREPEGKVAGDSRESLEQVFKEAVAEEIQAPRAKEAGKEGEVMVVLRGSQSTRVEKTRESGTESEAGTTSGREEEARTASGREETETTSGGEEEARTTSGREEEAETTSGREEEAETTSGGEEEAGTASGREEEAGTTSGGEAGTTSGGKEEAGTASGREEEAGTTSGGEEEAGTTSGREEEAGTTSGREEEAGITLGKAEAGTTSVGKEGNLSGAREPEYGEVVSRERISEGTGRTWAIEEAAREDQEEEVDEKRKAEMSISPKQSQALGTEGVEEAVKDQLAGRESAGGQGSEGEGEGFEVQADRDGEEAEGRQALVNRTVALGLEEVVQAEKAKEEGESCWIAEAELPKNKVANEAEGDAGLEATPEARLEKECRGEKSEGEAQTGGEGLALEGSGLEHEVTEGQDPELMAAPQTPTEQPEEGLGEEEEPRGIPALNKEETERSPEEYPRNLGYGKPGASGTEAQRRDLEGGDSHKEKADAEEGEEEAVGSQASEEAKEAEEAEGGQESALPDVLEAGGVWKKAEEAGCGAEEGEARGAQSQEPGGRFSAGAGAGRALGESDARDTEDEEAEATVPCRADTTSSGVWGLEEAALSLQDSEDTGVSSSAAEIAGDKADGRAAAPGRGPKREAGEAWESEGRQEAGGGKELVEAAWEKTRGGPEFGLEGSADMEVNSKGGPEEAFEAGDGEPRGECAEVRESAAAEGGCGMDGSTWGSQVARAEGATATVEAEGLPGGQTPPREQEAAGWQLKEQGQGGEGQRGDLHPEKEAQRPLDVEGVEVTEDQRAEAEEIVPEGPEDIQGQEDQSTHQEPGPRGETAASPGGDAHGSWSEALLPGSRLDVSVSRSRVLLSRSSSQRRSRPSFRRTPAPERQEEPPSPPAEEEPSAPEQRLLRPEEPPEASPPRPEGTPPPARRRPLGHGFGLAHPGMMQELQARLGRPKPQ